jgi:hypothetical protein
MGMSVIGLERYSGDPSAPFHLPNDSGVIKGPAMLFGIEPSISKYQFMLATDSNTPRVWKCFLALVWTSTQFLVIHLAVDPNSAPVIIQSRPRLIRYEDPHRWYRSSRKELRCFDFWASVNGGRPRVIVQVNCRSSRTHVTVSLEVETPFACIMLPRSQRPAIHSHILDKRDGS